MNFSDIHYVSPDKYRGEVKRKNILFTDNHTVKDDDGLDTISRIKVLENFVDFAIGNYSKRNS